MMQSLEGKKCLASIALFGEICKKNYDIYGTLSVFIKDLIALKNLYDFTALEIKRDLNDYFSFSIPENVIKSSLKRLSSDIQLRDHSYHVTNKFEIRKTLNERQQEIDKHNQTVVKSIEDYIESKMKRNLSFSEKTAIFESIYNFLLDGGYSSNLYTKYISSYIIEHSKEVELIKSLNIIKEGVLLYSGFQYSPEEYSKNTWDYPLVLYFDTEILFSLYGLNGELYKDLVCELLDLINKVNKKSIKNNGKPIIEFFYFKEIENEINNFFNAAISIVNCEDKPFQKTQAMKNIVNGCETKVDVLRKKALFFERLNSYGFKCDNNDYYKKEYYPYNIESQEVINEIFKELQEQYASKDMEYGISLLNKISILRKGKKSRFIEAKYFLVTANSMYFKLANHPKIINGGIVPVVSPVELIIEKIWIKTNTGLAPSGIKNIDVIIRSQFVVSSQMNISISEKMSEVEKLYKEQKISIQQANAVLTELREYRHVSENLNPENVESGINFTETSINKFIENYNLLSETVEKTKAERDQALSKLSEKEKQLCLLEKTEERKTTRKILFFKRLKILLSLVFFLMSIAGIYYIHTLDSIGWIKYILSTIGTIGAIIAILNALGIKFKTLGIKFKTIFFKKK